MAVVFIVAVVDGGGAVYVCFLNYIGKAAGNPETKTKNHICNFLLKTSFRSEQINKIKPFLKAEN